LLTRPTSELPRVLVQLADLVPNSSLLVSGIGLYESSCRSVEYTANDHRVRVIKVFG
jgi:hypothetical protein